MRNKVDEALDEVDQILDRVQPRPVEEEPKSEWDIDTARHEIEELRKTVDQVRVREPSQPQIIVIPKQHSSSPPGSKNRPSTWIGIAAVITALGGAAGIQQCASQAQQRIKPHDSAAKP